MDEFDKMLELALLALDEDEEAARITSPLPPTPLPPTPAPVTVKSLRFRTSLVEHFRDILNLFAPFREDITFKANYEGISIKALDPAHIALIKAEFSTNFFEEYEISGDEVICAINARELLRLLPRNLKGVEELSFSYSTDNPQLAKLTLGNYSSSKELTLSTLEPSNIPDVKVTWQTQRITINTKHLYRIIKQLPIETFMNSISLMLNEDGLLINFKNDSITIRNTISKYDPNVYEISCESEAKVILSAEYFLKFLKYASKINDITTLEIATNKPIKAILYGTSAKIEYMQAPRIEG